jgi:hypothetical protein
MHGCLIGFFILVGIDWLFVGGEPVECSNPAMHAGRNGSRSKTKGFGFTLHIVFAFVVNISCFLTVHVISQPLFALVLYISARV